MSKNVDDKSKMGYRDDSPYRNEPFIDINTPTGIIDMSATGTPLYANGKLLEPYSGQHDMGTTQVREVPVQFAAGGPMNALPVGDENNPPKKKPSKEKSSKLDGLTDSTKAFWGELATKFNLNEGDINSAFRTPEQGVGKNASTSKHNIGEALDINPKYTNVYKWLNNTKEGLDLMVKYNMGIIDETNPEIMKATGATGEHFHLGTDSKYAQAAKDRRKNFSNLEEQLSYKELHSGHVEKFNELPEPIQSKLGNLPTDMQYDVLQDLYANKVNSDYDLNNTLDEKLNTQNELNVQIPEKNQYIDNLDMSMGAPKKQPKFGQGRLFKQFGGNMKIPSFLQYGGYLGHNANQGPANPYLQDNGLNSGIANNAPTQGYSAQNFSSEQLLADSNGSQGTTGSQGGGNGGFNTMGAVNAAASGIYGTINAQTNDNLTDVQKDQLTSQSLEGAGDSVIGAIPGFGQAYGVIEGGKDIVSDQLGTTEVNAKGETQKIYNSEQEAMFDSAIQPTHQAQLDSVAGIIDGDAGAWGDAALQFALPGISNLVTGYNDFHEQESYGKSLNQFGGGINTQGAPAALPARNNPYYAEQQAEYNSVLNNQPQSSLSATMSPEMLKQFTAHRDANTPSMAGLNMNKVVYDPNSLDANGIPSQFLPYYDKPSQQLTTPQQQPGIVNTNTQAALEVSRPHRKGTYVNSWGQSIPVENASFQMGGPMGGFGANNMNEIPVTEFNTGGSHDENPNGGIPQGRNENGQLNLVEEGELKFPDPRDESGESQFVVSADKKMKFSKEVVAKHNLPKKYIGKTVLDVANKILRKGSGREGDAIEENSKRLELIPFVEAHSEMSAEMNAKHQPEVNPATMPVGFQAGGPMRPLTEEQAKWEAVKNDNPGLFFGQPDIAPYATSTDLIGAQSTEDKAAYADFIANNLEADYQNRLAENSKLTTGFDPSLGTPEQGGGRQSMLNAAGQMLPMAVNIGMGLFGKEDKLNLDRLRARELQRVNADQQLREAGYSEAGLRKAIKAGAGSGGTYLANLQRLKNMSDKNRANIHSRVDKQNAAIANQEQMLNLQIDSGNLGQQRAEEMYGKQAKAAKNAQLMTGIGQVAQFSRANQLDDLAADYNRMYSDDFMYEYEKPFTKKKKK